MASRSHAETAGGPPAQQSEQPVGQGTAGNSDHSQRIVRPASALGGFRNEVLISVSTRQHRSISR